MCSQIYTSRITSKPPTLWCFAANKIGEAGNDNKLVNKVFSEEIIKIEAAEIHNLAAWLRENIDVISRFLDISGIVSFSTGDCEYNMVCYGL